MPLNTESGWAYSAGKGVNVGTYTGKSCLFSGSNEFLNKTWGTTETDADKFTISMWIKRNNTDSGSTQYWLVGAQTGAESNIKIQYDKIDVHLTGSNYDFRGTRVLRDTSAWYHLVFRYDSDEGSAGDRFRCYINGELETWATSSTIPSGQDGEFLKDTNAIQIGSYDGSSNMFNGYIAQVVALDGQSLAPASFAETSSDTGAWIMKEPLTGLTFGNNGFLLEFKETGTGTASTSTIGADTSGETNHLTSNNMVSGDSARIDTPVNNFCTLNALSNVGTVLSEGNLKATADSADYHTTESTFAVSSGKWYVEYGATDADSTGNTLFGIHLHSAGLAGISAVNYLGKTSTSYAYSNNGNIYSNNAVASSAPAEFDSGDVIAIALDMDANTIKWYKNNNLEVTTTSVPDGLYTFVIQHHTNEDGVMNFGQDSSFSGTETAQNNADGNGEGDFYYSPPSGYLALCSKNLPEVEIGQEADDLASDYFNTVIYTGNDTSGHAITGMGFSPDLLWIQPRSNGDNGVAFDAVRGSDKQLKLNGTDTEDTHDPARITLEADGFDLDTTDANYNGNARTYVAHGWLAGTAFSGTSTGSGTGKDYSGQSNEDAGFSVSTYLGNGSAGHTIPHNLSVAPDFVVVKRRTGSADWWGVFHSANTSAPATDYLVLNATDATADLDEVWNDVLPSSSVVTLGTNNGVNGNDVPYLMYAFHNVEGYSHFGSYTGNGNADGAFCWTGFEPAFVMTKRVDSTSQWGVWDNKRSTNPNNATLYANTTDGEVTTEPMDFLSNGFKLRNSNADPANASGGTYVFMAFSSGTGFKYGTAN